MDVIERAILSPREVQCLSGVADGLKNNDIAAKLHISVPTVALHLQNAKRKLGAMTREHAIALALKKGLLPS